MCAWGADDLFTTADGLGHLWFDKLISNQEYLYRNEPDNNIH